MQNRIISETQAVIWHSMQSKLLVFLRAIERWYLSLTFTSSIIPLLSCGPLHHLLLGEPAPALWMDGDHGKSPQGSCRMWMSQHGGLNGWARLLCHLSWGKGDSPTTGYPEEQGFWHGTCWNFFLAVPVSRSCGSICGGSGDRLAQIYMPGLSLALTAVPPGLPSFRVLCYKM